MNPNVKIYRDNGLCNNDEKNNIRFKDCKDDIYKKYRKYIDLKFYNLIYKRSI